MKFIQTYVEWLYLVLGIKQLQQKKDTFNFLESGLKRWYNNELTFENCEALRAFLRPGFLRFNHTWVTLLIGLAAFKRITGNLDLLVARSERYHDVSVSASCASVSTAHLRLRECLVFHSFCNC